METSITLPYIKIEPLFHREKDCVALRFAYREDLLPIVRKLRGATFSKTNRCWYAPMQPDSVEEIKRLFEGRAKLDFASFKMPEPQVEIKAPAEDEATILRMMEQKLHLKGYSQATAKTYTEQFKLFLRFFRFTSLGDITETDIRNYLLYLIEDRKLSKSTQNQAINAIKFFYEKILGEERTVYYLERPIKDKTLPEILSEEEILQIFSVDMNKKHRLMLMLIYSGGLRRSELLSLRKGDVDTHRGVMFIKGGKGKKDRQTILAQAVIPYVQAYQKETKTHYWFFEGLDNKPYSPSSLQTIFRKAVEQAGISKKVHLHTLRHSFATHLLEGGTSTRYIQELLGHESPLTTEVYTQVSKFSLSKIKSPLDKIAPQKSLES